jgi:large subunit ribosomal protein L10
MPTPRKESIVSELTEKLGRSSAVVLVEAQGLPMTEQVALRKKLRAAGMEFVVVKNTLLRMATHNAHMANIDAVLNGPTAAAFGFDDEAALAKTVSEYIKTSKVVKIKGGLLGKQALTISQVEALSTVPSRNDVRSQAVGAINGPTQQTATILSAPMRDLVQILHNYAEKQGATL